ncbi:hypothetical protein ES703_118796 [subsurface metagenome]
MAFNEKKKQAILTRLKCVVCSTRNVFLEQYQYKQTVRIKTLANLRKNSKFIFTMESPICQACKKKFYKWRIFNIISILIFVLGLTSLITGIFFLFFHQILGDSGVPIIGFGFLFTLTSLTFRYILGKIESNPSNYFFYDSQGKIFYVKPKEETDWIPYSLWIKTIVRE